MKRRYEKPYVASERVFSLASQACDVMKECPGICASEIAYEGCYKPWKVKDVFCGSIPINPVMRS